MHRHTVFQATTSLTARLWLLPRSTWSMWGSPQRGGHAPQAFFELPASAAGPRWSALSSTPSMLSASGRASVFSSRQFSCASWIGKNGLAGSNLNPVGLASCSHNPGHVAGLQKTSLSMWLAEFVFRYSGIRIGVSGNIPSPGDGFSSGILGSAANRTKRSGLAFLVLARSTIMLWSGK